MNPVKRKLLLLACLCLPPLIAHAAFEERPAGARPAAMGGICAAYTDDVYSIYQNPAGLESLRQTEFTVQYSRLHVGLDDNSDLGYSFIGIAHPLAFKRSYGTVGFGWLRFELPGLYQENAFLLSYAKSGLLPRTSFGINVKSLGIGYGADEYTANALDSFGNATALADGLFAGYGTSKSAIDFDLGIQYSLSKNYRLGLMLANITEPNLALQPSVQAPLPRVFKAGVVHIGGKYRVNVDGLMRQANGISHVEVSAGAERFFGQGIAVRGSVNVSNRDSADVALGMGYTVDGLQFDYALLYPMTGLKDTLGSHRVSVLVRFGPRMQSVERELGRDLESEKHLRLLAEQKLESAGKELETLRSRVKTMEDRETDKARQRNKTAADTAEKQAASTAAAAEYLGELNSYRKAAPSLNLSRKRATVKAIVDRYRDTADVSEAAREYDALSEEIAVQTKSYQDSVTYYRKMVERGIPPEEQSEVLRRIIKKYEDMGLDVSAAKKELESIKRKEK